MKLPYKHLIPETYSNVHIVNLTVFFSNVREWQYKALAVLEAFYLSPEPVPEYFECAGHNWRHVRVRFYKGATTYFCEYVVKAEVKAECKACGNVLESNGTCTFCAVL